MDFETKKTFYRETFANINLTKGEITGKEFENCMFENCSFVETILEKCIFTDCAFNSCILSAVKTNLSIFSEVKFHNSKVIGIDWTRAQSIRSLEFQNCQLTYSNFKLLKLAHLKIIDCQATDMDFSGTDLTDASLENSDLTNTRFLNTNLFKTSFRKSTNYAIDFKTNKLKKTVFSLPEAISLLNTLDIILEN
jgi:uncharacterized protein YjbI with pentapeptide repeats